MEKRRLLTVLAIVVLIGGARLANVGPAAARDPASLSSVVDPAPDWDIAGTIQQINGEFWTIEGFVVRVTVETQVVGDVPTIGTFARAQGIVVADGTWLATSIQVGSATTPTPGPVPTATPIPGPHAETPTATPSPAPTPPTATPIPVTMRAADDGDRDDDRDAGEKGGKANRGPKAPKDHPAPGRHGHGPQGGPGAD